MLKLIVSRISELHISSPQSTIEPAFFQSNRDKNFDLAMTGLVTELKDVQPPAAVPNGNKM